MIIHWKALETHALLSAHVRLTKWINCL